MAKENQKPQREYKLPKSPTGIKGLDSITEGGLPKGRPTLIAGSAGSGKTILGMEFLIHGALDYNEPGVFMAFEETEEDLKNNVKSLGYDLQELIDKKKIYIDHVKIERNQIEETGEYDLEALFVRLDLAINSVGAKRVVLDTIESLFSGLLNTTILRAELRRLFGWLKEKKVTAIITGERGETMLTRQGLEEYVSDAVILLDHKIHDQISTRRIRIVKYRGSTHGTNEYPFLIDEQGISVLPITALQLNHTASKLRISTGIERLDNMLGGKGYYRGSSVLLSGTAGAGKTSLASFLALATAKNKGKVLYFAFEESPDQIIRNMESIGLNLEPFIKKGLIKFHASRPTLYGLEMHLVTIHKMIEEFDPSVVIFDPISNLINVGTVSETRSMLTRLIDYLKTKQVTNMMTALTYLPGSIEETKVGISSLVDTWILLKDVDSEGERNRTLEIIKSRGMDHSNQLREFLITDNGIDLLEVYTGSLGVLTGTSRVIQEFKEKAEEKNQKLEIDIRQREIARKKNTLQAKIAALQEMYENEKDEEKILKERVKIKVLSNKKYKDKLLDARKADR